MTACLPGRGKQRRSEYNDCIEVMNIYEVKCRKMFDRVCVWILCCEFLSQPYYYYYYIQPYHFAQVRYKNMEDLPVEYDGMYQVTNTGKKIHLQKKLSKYSWKNVTGFYGWFPCSVCDASIV